MKQKEALNAQVCIASHNDGKIREFRNLLSMFGCANVISAKSMGIHLLANETGNSFYDNSLLKLRSITCHANFSSLCFDKTLVIADDSGLCISVLDGKPGVLSARYATQNGYLCFSSAMFNLWQEMQKINSDDTTASFICVISVFYCGKEFVFSGRIDGDIVYPPRVCNSNTEYFGYDPFFVPRGHNLTFAEMLPAQKMKLCHRFLSMQQLYKFIL